MMIYPAVYAQMFDKPYILRSNRGAIEKS